MELNKAIELIMPAAGRLDGVTSWADLGCGTGLFTSALGHILQKGSTVYAIDKRRDISEALLLPVSISLKKVMADFVDDELELSGLNGILMANSLHFVARKEPFLNKSSEWLKIDGCFLLIEYDTDTSNPWVPYPLSFSSAKVLFASAGFSRIRKLAEQPSLYHRAAIYSALAER